VPEPVAEDAVPGVVFPASYAAAIAQVLACDSAGSAGVAVRDLLVAGGSSVKQQLAYALWAEGVACTVQEQKEAGGKGPAEAKGQPAAKKARA
jgi:hypothetical protein